MKLLACVMIGGLLFPVPANAICVDVPLEKDIASARSVFIATITTAAMSKPLSTLRDKEPYSVSYGFVVTRRIKGDPSIVSALTTGARFDDPTDKRFWQQAEQSRYVPGDSILVVADRPGDATVSSIGCAASRPWDRDAYRRTVSLPGFAP